MVVGSTCIFTFLTAAALGATQAVEETASLVITATADTDGAETSLTVALETQQLAYETNQAAEQRQAEDHNVARARACLGRAVDEEVDLLTALTMKRDRATNLHAQVAAARNPLQAPTPTPYKSEAVRKAEARKLAEEEVQHRRDAVAVEAAYAKAAAAAETAEAEAAEAEAEAAAVAA